MLDIQGCVPEISQQLANQGWTCIETGLDPDDVQSVRKLLLDLGGMATSSTEQAPEISMIAPTDYATSLAGSDKAMTFHTDNAYLAEPCKTVALFCRQQADSGGESELVDGLAVLHEISTDALDRLQEPIWAWHNPETGQASEKFTVTDAVREKLRWWRTTLAMKDAGALAVADVFDAAIHSASRHQLRLKPGDLLITDNQRMLHNRQAFSGKRVLYRARYW